MVTTKIPRIVLTGGPCAGKSSAEMFLKKKFEAIGYCPVFVPEASTMLMNEGHTPLGGTKQLREFQKRVIDRILALELECEDELQRLAHPKPVIICDRGLMDGRAYMPEEMFWEVIAEHGLDLSNMRDARYLGVFHLRSTALGAEEYYTQTNNKIRRETIDEARLADERTLEAWIGHPHLRVIDNSGNSFDDKLEALWRHVSRLVGEPEPLEVERKFLVRLIDLRSIGIAHQTAEIEQIYLFAGDHSLPTRIRKRTQSGASTCVQTVKRDITPGVRHETETHISADEYADKAKLQDTRTLVIKKQRTCFVWNNQYFELDVFEKPYKDLCLLEIELINVDDIVDIPPWIEVIKEVTDDPAYSNHALASQRVP